MDGRHIQARDISLEGCLDVDDEPNTGYQEIKYLNYGVWLETKPKSTVD